MATRAIFVGVNKHRDPTIPELGGARRDATALWALFTDTIEGLSAHLLVDGLDGDARRGTTSRVTAHPIRHDIELQLIINKEAVLIVIALAPDVRQASGENFEAGGRGLPCGAGHTLDAM